MTEIDVNLMYGIKVFFVRISPAQLNIYNIKESLTKNYKYHNCYSPLGVYRLNIKNNLMSIKHISLIATIAFMALRHRNSDSACHIDFAFNANNLLQFS